MNTLKNFTKGLIKENPVLVLVLGTCPTLATSTSVINALGEKGDSRQGENTLLYRTYSRLCYCGTDACKGVCTGT